jgi:hypothetical protein
MAADLKLYTHLINRDKLDELVTRHWTEGPVVLLNACLSFVWEEHAARLVETCTGKNKSALVRDLSPELWERLGARVVAASIFASICARCYVDYGRLSKMDTFVTAAGNAPVKTPFMQHIPAELRLQWNNSRVRQWMK